MDSPNSSTSGDHLAVVGFFLILIIAASIRMLLKVAKTNTPKSDKKAPNDNLEIYSDDLCLASDVMRRENNRIDLSAILFTKMAWNNAEILKGSVECGCFDCLEKFHFFEIVDWVDDEPINTAECPKCASDCVVGFKSNTKKNDLILKALNLRYF